MNYCKALLAITACFVTGAVHAAPVMPSAGRTLQNARLTIVFGSTANGYSVQDKDRVDAIAWVNSAGSTVSNYVTSGGPSHCGDPQEFFGEAYGDTGDTGVPRPHAVIGGITATLSNGSATAATATVKSLTSCDETLDMKSVTVYSLSTRPGRASSMSIVRTFKAPQKVTSGNIRAYVPRLPLGTYPVVLVPDAMGVVLTYNANNCPLNCTVTDWNGRWMADDDGNGNGMVIFRDPATNPPAQLTIDYDGYSNSNNSAITLLMPKKGWRGAVTETEYLCFYDATSWTAKQRAKGNPPTGCSDLPH